jgi:hypothetical protein
MHQPGVEPGARACSRTVALTISRKKMGSADFTAKPLVLDGKNQFLAVYIL